MPVSGMVLGTRSLPARKDIRGVAGPLQSRSAWPGGGVSIYSCADGRLPEQQVGNLHCSMERPPDLMRLSSSHRLDQGRRQTGWGQGLAGAYRCLSRQLALYTRRCLVILGEATTVPESAGGEIGTGPYQTTGSRRASAPTSALAQAHRTNRSPARHGRSLSTLLIIAVVVLQSLAAQPDRPRPHSSAPGARELPRQIQTLDAARLTWIRTAVNIGTAA